MTSVLMDALEHGNTVEETDEAMLRLGLPMAPSVLLAMVGPRVANHVLVTLHDAYPDRFPLSPTLANYADGNDEIVVVEQRPRTVDEITRDVLEAMADEIRHLLDEGVVADAADVDACLILGAGWPFFLGGITPYLAGSEGLAPGRGSPGRIGVCSERSRSTFLDERALCEKAAAASALPTCRKPPKSLIVAPSRSG